MSHQPHPVRTGGNARRLIVAGCLGLGVVVLAQGCASVSIEDAVPSGALAGGTAPASSATTASLETLPPPVAPDASAPRASALVAEPAPNPSPAAAASLAEVDGVGPSAPRETGRFPNLNVPPRTATEQFTRAESTAKTRELRNAASQIKSAGGDITADKKELERLRKLGESHGKDALKAIEKR